MPVRQLSKASTAASASSSSETTMSTVRVRTADGELSAGVRIFDDDFSLGRGHRTLVRHETRFGHQVLVERVVFFQGIGLSARFSM